MARPSRSRSRHGLARVDVLRARDARQGGADRLRCSYPAHPALPLLSYDEQIAEMKNSFSLLQSRLPRVLPIVAYPYGLYDRMTVRAARAAGMNAGLTMEGRATADHPDPM